MIPAWSYLDERDRAVLRETVAFLNKRLEESATIDWALRLKPAQRIERLAVEDLLNGPGARDLVEPWATGWRLIEESWSTSAAEDGPATAIYGIQERLRRGDHSGAIISKIVDLVAPRLKVEPIESWRWQFVKKPRHPKSFEDLLSARLTSGGLVDLHVLELANLTNVGFLKALANTLECTVTQGLEIARRLGWDGQRRLWQLGGLARVYYTTAVPHADADNESEGDPDAYNLGIAPSVKLLYAVVSRIAALNTPDALPFVQRWRLAPSSLHIRLWAAAARDEELVSAEEVGAFLLGLDDDQFWDLNNFPEVAELRALRFRDLNVQEQEAIARRLRKGPGHTAVPKKARLYWTVRELKRIEVGGGTLPPKEQVWMDAKISQFAGLVAMDIVEGFPEATKTYYVPPNPDTKYDALNGVARLRALETALSTSRGGWNDDPAERANDWLQQIENVLLVLNDLEVTGNGGDGFPRVWNRFGWAHSPKDQDTRSNVQRNFEAEANRVLALLNLPSEATLSAAIEGISAWMDAWEKQVVASELGLPVWMRIWPVAVEATNSKSDNADDADLSVVARVVGDDREPMDLDTLNTPAGKLVGVFLEAWRAHTGLQNPFEPGSTARQMRDIIISATGRSLLIVRHRLIEYLPYFVRADRTWTDRNLIAPLLNDDGASLALWRAIARRTHFSEVLKIIGNAMSERATDRRLGRETRRRLVFSLIIESLHAFREHRQPAVPNSRIQQMLRTLDDEVRASAANAIQQFVRELSAKGKSGSEAPTPADLFRSAAVPFLQQVWPQERSLATPGVSGAFSDLPATSGEAFAEAVDAIERFLVPFECWSLLEYGLYGEDGGEKKLAMINSEAKARALLRLFDLTIGNSEGAVIPYGLTEALDQIRAVEPELTKDPIYRRLSTAARR
ncbi:MAG: hypothetical protein EOR72_32215 [Mesorhizobium sp.]|uniref:hypothetical protein n=1 Tax=Mesorhizobium sp. TaxID=1871066 RepID=UPI000FE80009|nr:hypothetical protein [Mesorhizobium sp.]RWM06061.1 MAG: hypothetical protein EOR72_32215 [Mesorhizobium sp.]